MKSITRAISAQTSTMHATPPGGGAAAALAFPRAGLYFAIAAMVASVAPLALRGTIESMTRRWWIPSALSLTGCGQKPQLPAGLFPQQAPGGWTLVEARDVPASEAPDPVPRNSIDRLRAATYKSGDAEVDARVYLLTSPDIGSALGARWRPSAETVFFDHGPYFAVIKWQGADRKSLQAFVADLQRRLGAIQQR